MFAFLLKWPLKSSKIESAFIRRPQRMILFQRRWKWVSLLCSGCFHVWGHFHRANRETHYQPAPERSAPELSVSRSPAHPHRPLSSASAPCYLWPALWFISTEHLFQWLSLPLLSATVRVKSRALSLDWNHLSHGPGLELISAEAMVRCTPVPTPLLTQGAAQSSHWTTQMASTYYTASSCQQKIPPFLFFNLQF